MKASATGWTGVLIVAGVIAAAPARADDRGPVLSGRPLGEWIADLRHKDFQVQSRAADVILKVGPATPDALDMLLGEFGRSETPFGARRVLIQALANFGPEAKAAVPALAAMLAGKGNLSMQEEDAAYTLLAIGAAADQERAAVKRLLCTWRKWAPSVLVSQPKYLQKNSGKLIPHLTALLADADAEKASGSGLSACRAAAQSLAIIGPPAKEAVAALRTALSAADADAAADSAWALAKVEPQQTDEAVAALVGLLEAKRTKLASPHLSALCPEAAEALVRLLAHRDGEVRLAASAALRPVVKGSQGTTRTLIAAMSDGSPLVRAGVAELLAAPPAELLPQAAAVLKTALRDVEEAVRLAAAASFVRVAVSESGLALPVLVGVLGSGASADRRRQAADVLGGLGASAKSAAADLTKALADKEPAVRTAAARALCAAAPASAEPAVAVLAEAVRTEPTLPVLAALERIGALGKPAGQDVLDLMNRDKKLALAAAKALSQIDPERAPAIMPMLIGLASIKGYGADKAVEVIGGFGTRADSALPLLLEMLRDKSGYHRQAAAEAVVRISPDHAAEVITLLRAETQDGGSAVDSLCRIARLVPNVGVPVLIDMLQDEKLHPHDRDRVIRALGDVRPAAKKTIALLRRLCEDPRFRPEAEKALAKIAGSTAQSPTN